MVRKLTRELICLLLILLLAGLTVCAQAEGAMVVDDAGLFTDSEIDRLEAMIQDIQETYQMDAVVLTTRDTPFTSNDSVLVDYADRYFEDNGYGLGEDRAGVLLMIDMNNRYFYLSTAGVMIDYLSDSRIENILDDAFDAMEGSGTYGSAAIAALTRVQRYLRAGIEEGSFRYDAATGKRLTGLYNRLTTAEALFALLVGAAVALLIVLSVRGGYSLAGTTYHYDRGRLSSRHLSMENEQFLRQHITRTRTPPPSSGGGSSGGGHAGGSAVHTSSGGMSHGGGGRHF